MLTAAALVPQDLGELRAACLEVVASLPGSGAERVVVVGPGPQTQRWESGELPPALAVGASLLDEVGVDLPRVLQGMGPRVPRPRAVDLGAAHVLESPTALLVCGNGSAGRDAAFDAAVEAAVRAGDPEALLALDPMVAEQLEVGGLTAWQVLAGAARGRSWSARVTSGRGSLVALWT